MPQTSRRRKLLLLYLLVAAIVAGALMWRQSERLESGRLLRQGQVVSQGEIAIGGPFTLTDHNGRRVSDADFRGRFMLVYFGFTFCPDVCPTTLAMVADALDRLTPQERARIAPILISVDPERDTPEVLKDYVASFGPDFIGLTGSTDDIAAVERAYDIHPRKLAPQGKNRGIYSVEHTNYLYLMGPDGKIVEYFTETGSPQTLAQKLRAAL